MKFFDPDHPFLRPLWRRIVIVVATLAWAGVEFMNGAVGWGFVFLAAALYCGLHFFVVSRPKQDDTTGGADE